MFTTQDKLGRFGKRWGCLATCLINVVESELGRRLTPFERKACVGAWHESENVLVSNYKHHEILYPEPAKWDSIADPEWHFLVFGKNGTKYDARNKALFDLLQLFNIKTLLHRYDIIEIVTKYGPHFLLRIDGIDEVNPDASLSGEVVEVQPIG